MIATSSPFSAARGVPAGSWAAPLGLALGLAAIVGARLLAVRAGLDPLFVGAAFGCALGALALVGLANRGRIRAALPASTVRFILVGVSAGLVLTAVAVVGPALAGVSTVPGLGRPAAPFAPWVLVTLLVAAAEEALLRGALFDLIERSAGLTPAIVLTTLAFALMHVPLYGWHVVPLDLAVGLVLAGLRISTRGLLAPIAAHATADLASWWL